MLAHTGHTAVKGQSGDTPQSLPSDNKRTAVKSPSTSSSLFHLHKDQKEAEVCEGSGPADCKTLGKVLSFSALYFPTCEVGGSDLEVPLGRGIWGQSGQEDQLGVAQPGIPFPTSATSQLDNFRGNAQCREHSEPSTKPSRGTLLMILRCWVLLLPLLHPPWTPILPLGLSVPSHPNFLLLRQEPSPFPKDKRQTWRVGAGQEAPKGVKEENQVPHRLLLPSCAQAP